MNCMKLNNNKSKIVPFKHINKQFSFVKNDFFFKQEAKHREYLPSLPLTNMQCKKEQTSCGDSFSNVSENKNSD